MHLSTHLNPEQQKAAEHVEGPMLVIAGAGSGKTRIVTYRIAYLLSLGVPASAILAVTFTNKAASEMRERIHRLTQSAILSTTFHSLGARILRESIGAIGYSSDFAIFDEEDSEKVLKECLKERNVKEEKGLVKEVRMGISHAKNALLTAEQVTKEDPFLADIYTLYKEKLKLYNGVDFDDLLYLPVRLFQESPETLSRYQQTWSFILVDEYQDTNEAQYNLLRLLSQKHQNVFAVGDPDQSIYSWRGANIGNILHFEADYPGAKVAKLEHNYRSTSHILSGANGLIQHNESRYEKNLWSQRGEGEKIGLYLADSEKEEVNFVVEKLQHHHYKQNVPFSDSVIFYRTHFQSRSFEDALLRERIPYIIIGGVSFYQRREIKDILAFLRVATTPGDFLSFSRTINLPKRGIGPATLAKIRLAAGSDLIRGSEEMLEGRRECPLSQKQAHALASYIRTIRALQHHIHAGEPIAQILSEAIEESRYSEVLKEEPDTAEDREGNLDELISKATEWQGENENGSLSAFLEELTLKGTQEETHEQDAVRMMTLHNGKGLEFHSAYLVGMEEELFPHANALGNPEALEEERRLCYVGMTRAKDLLYLSAARMRFLWGTLRPMRPSRFFSEIPEEHCKKLHKEAYYSSYDSPPDALEPFNVGSTVFHRDFGKGRVQKVYNTSLGLTYDVLFQEEEGGIRSLVAKYARLEKR